MKKLIACIAAIMMMAGVFAAVASAEEVKLTREEAVQVVLDYAGLKEEQVVFTKVRTDWDDGRQIWEIDFVFDGVEYEFDVDFYTGRILEADMDRADRDYDRDYDWDDWFDFD